MKQPSSSYSNQVCLSLSFVVYLYLIIVPIGYSGIISPPLSKNRVKLMHITDQKFFISTQYCIKFTSIAQQLKLCYIYCFNVGRVEMLARYWNARMKQVNGNIVRIVHMNKGKTILHNSNPILKDFLNTTLPEICSLNEANVIIDSDLHKNGIMDFTCEISKPPPGYKHGRACLLISRHIKYS